MADRRATIEAALDTLEQNPDADILENPPVVSDTPQEGETGKTTEAPTDKPTDKPIEGATDKPTDKSTEKPNESDDKPTEGAGDKTYSIDKAPQSWKAGPKGKWGALDPDVRQEIIRRERDNERVLNESASARQLATALNQVVSPYMARINSLGVHPIAAIHELLKADHLLSSSNKVQQAKFMAKLISDYAVDIEALDAALAGQPIKGSENDKLEQLLQQRLQPFMKFIEEQTRGNEERQGQMMAKMQNDIAAMSDNPEFPEFDAVREDMADIIEIQAKKGVYLSLEQAYTRAIAMNPEVSDRVQKMKDAAKARDAAQSSHARAQQAARASKSVSGAPNGSVTGGSTDRKDRRATIEAAFDQLEGR